MGIFAERIINEAPDDNIGTDDPGAAGAGGQMEGAADGSGGGSDSAAEGGNDATDFGGDGGDGADGSDTGEDGGDTGGSNFGGMGGGGTSGGGMNSMGGGEITVEDKAKKQKLYHEYETVCGTMEELQSAIEGLGSDETLTEREKKVLSSLLSQLVESRESLDLVMTQKFLAMEYSSLLMLLINFRTTTVIISKVMTDILKDDKEKEKTK
jgi:hypothetical protein